MNFYSNDRYDQQKIVYSLLAKELKESEELHQIRETVKDGVQESIRRLGSAFVRMGSKLESVGSAS